MEKPKESKNKVYVRVNVDFSEDGDITPIHLTWEDGTRYYIDDIIGKCPAPALRAGGQGLRFTIVVNNQISYLFFSKDADITTDLPGKWFVERKERGKHN